MQLEHSFTVPVPVADAWKVLLDIEQIAPCMPGAVLDSVDGDDFTGRVKVKLGPISLTYKGKASFVKKDEATHTAVIDAAGKDQRGNGTAAATVTATLKDDGGSATRVDVLTDLNITGKPAQFGRGVMVDVGNKLIGQFATCVEGKLSGSADSGDAEDAEEAGAAGTSASGDATAAGAASAGTGSAGTATAGTGSAGTATAGTGSAGTATADGAGSDDQPDTGEAGGRHAAEAAAAPGAGKVAASSGAAAPGADSATSSPAAGGTGGGPSAGSAGSSTARVRAVPAREPEPIDLLDVAGGSVVTRFGIPAAGLFAALTILFVIIRKIRS